MASIALTTSLTRPASLTVTDFPALSASSLRFAASTARSFSPIGALKFRKAAYVLRRGGYARCSNNSNDESGAKLQAKEEGVQEWAIMKRWDVPWEWHTVSLTSLACGLSFTTAVVLGVIFTVCKSYPLSDEFFRYDLREPFNLQKGWLLWAVIGLIGALIGIGLTGVALSTFGGEVPQRETDALVRLLPLIGSSSISTISLLGVTGVLAPLLEETIFRGFFLVALTKWLHTPVAVLISAAVFALAHLTPGQFPQLFVLGVALGFSYAHTRNLMTSITIHALWNSGVILLLTFLQLQGYDIREMLQAAS